MSSKNPIDDLFDEINGLLSFVEKNIKSTPMDEELPDDIVKKLNDIEKRVDLLNKLSEDIVALANVPKEEVKMRLSGLSSSLPEIDKQMVSKGDVLKLRTEDILQKVEELAKEQERMGKQEDKTKSGAPANGWAAEEEEAGPAKSKEKPPYFSEPKETKPEEVRKRKNKFKRFGSDDKWKPL